MKRLSVARLVVCASVLGVMTSVAAIAPAQSVPQPTRNITLSGSGTTMYPTFAAATTRYAVATTAATGGSVQVTATTADPHGTVQVDGRRVTGPATVSGLVAGDEIPVVIDDSAGRTAYAIVYLPAQFPALTATGGADAQPGLIGLTLNTFDGTKPAFEGVFDRNGVPSWIHQGEGADLDLRRQANGEITISRPTTTPGRSGVALVTLGDDFSETARREVQAPLTNTDNHDAERLPDGSTVLTGYEPNAATGKVDATIQKLDPAGTVVFTWTSASLASETVGGGADYAHINSVQTVGDDGDILASFRHFSAVMLIATEDHDGHLAGDVIWKLGGRDSDFTFVADPYPSGPCAQHTASRLADGHILIFDNGTDGYCVNPADPAGATINRHQTRVTEYALDTDAGTATLVWSWTPAGRFAFFAGGARRMANGNTLVAWAPEPSAISTEVNPAGEIVWELKETAISGPNFKAYRSEMLGDVPDAIDPTVTVSGPADGASYLQGTVVSPSVLCRDRGGSSLQTCEYPATLNTSIPGTRSYTVTGTDGAGNSTSVQRSYVVQPIVHRADAAIQLAGSTAWKGTGVVGSTSGQTARATIRGRTGKVSSTVLIRNIGNEPDAVTVLGYGSTRSFAVRYFAGTTDVTERVVAGTYRTPALAPGAATRLRVVVTKQPVAKPGQVRTVLVRSTSVASAGAVDRIALAVTARR